MNRMKSEKIELIANIAADRQKVWDCYTRPEHVTGWNFASPDWHCPWAKAELFAGGKFAWRMEARDGSFGFDFSGSFDVVKAPEILCYTLDDGRKVEVMMEETDDKTKVILTFEAESQNPVEMQRMGWQSILNQFKIYTESA